MQTLNEKIKVAVQALPAKNAESMAKAVYKVLCQASLDAGQKPSTEVMIRKPGEKRHFDDATCWCVAWEAGPYEWAIPASMVIGSASGKIVEPYYSFDLCFYPTED